MSRVMQFLHHQREPSSRLDEPRPPMGGARNEALGLVLVLLILTLIAAAFFWESARSRPAPPPHPLAVTVRANGDEGSDWTSPRAGSFSSVRESWVQTDIRSLRLRAAERLALAAVARTNGAG